MKALNKNKKSKTRARGWILYQGLYEINWKNGHAHEIAIEGVVLKVKYERPRSLKSEDIKNHV